MYTLDNITTTNSYTALKRRGFTNAQIVEFYNLADPIDRKRMFARLTQSQFNPIANPVPKIIVSEPIRQICSNELIGTQKCTIHEIAIMAGEYMIKDFIYRGRTFNMRDMGWKFEWMNTRNSFGRCARRKRRLMVDGSFKVQIYNKKIQLSKWLVNNSESTFEDWKDTMLHEIAHAIDVEIRGTSDHSNIWKNIASSVGAKPERTTEVKISAKNSKYTMTCINCGDKTASHKKKTGRASACIPCCNKYNNGKFSHDFKLEQTQNY